MKKVYFKGLCPAACSLFRFGYSASYASLFAMKLKKLYQWTKDLWMPCNDQITDQVSLFFNNAFA